MAATSPASRYTEAERHYFGNDGRRPALGGDDDAHGAHRHHRARAFGRREYLSRVPAENDPDLLPRERRGRTRTDRAPSPDRKQSMSRRCARSSPTGSRNATHDHERPDRCEDAARTHGGPRRERLACRPRISRHTFKANDPIALGRDRRASIAIAYVSPLPGSDSRI